MREKRGHLCPDRAKPIQARRNATRHPGSFQSNGCILKQLSPSGNPQSVLRDKGDSPVLSKELVCPHAPCPGTKTHKNVTA